MYIYESHIGGLFVSDDELDYDYVQKFLGNWEE